MFGSETGALSLALSPSLSLPLSLSLSPHPPTQTNLAPLGIPFPHLKMIHAVVPVKDVRCEDMLLLLRLEVDVFPENDHGPVLVHDRVVQFEDIVDGRRALRPCGER